MKKTAGTIVVLLAILHCFAQKPLPANMFVQKLSNGLTVLVVEDNSVPLATLEMVVKNGAFAETPEYNGLSHLYEHMFFQANKKYSGSGEFVDRMQELGISFNASTSDEMVNYYFTLPKYNLGEGLELMNAAMRYPSFKSAEIAKENAVVDAEFQRSESNPMWQLNNEMNHHLWGDQYCRKNAIGDHNIIRSATSDKLEDIRNRYYWPNNSMLIVAGDVAHEEVFVQVESMFGDWKPSRFDPFEKYPVPEFKPLEKDDYFVVESSSVQQPELLFSWEGPDTRRDTLNTYVADIFSYILMQHSSRFHQALVESGLALAFTANYSTKKFTGPITFRVTPNPGKIKECVAAFNDQIGLLDSEDYFPDDQLAISKKQYEIRSLREEEATSQFAQVLSYWFCSASIDYFNTYLDNLNKVSREDIRNYVRKYIKLKPHCAGLLLNPAIRADVKPETFFRSE